MAVNRMDPNRPGGEPAPGNGAEAAAPASVARSGGFSAWLPLLVTIIVMPLLAYATTSFILLPKLKNAVGATEAAPAPETAGHGDRTHGGGGGGHGTADPGAKQKVAMSKMIVNVAGTMGTRYLMTSVTLVGSHPNFETIIERNKAQLLDVATGTLSSKTISDLEKPGARNQIRTELISIFNNALGTHLVEELYFTELAIQ